MRLIILCLIISTNTTLLFAQNGFSDLSDSATYIPEIKITFGDQNLTMDRVSTQFDNLDQKRESEYGVKALPKLILRVVSSVTYLEDHPILKHELELSSVRKLQNDLTIYFPVNTLNTIDSVTMPLKNGVIHRSKKPEDIQIASYRCAGENKKYDLDIALPMIICNTGEKGVAVVTDPYFTSLYDKGAIQWTYPKEVGFEDSIEKRTIMEIEGVSTIEEGMNMYYQTILEDVPAGPNWIKYISMISYDYVSDNGKGWYNDIDTLVTLVPREDREKIALTMHGWYDIVGRYCYNQKTGKLDETWTNRIRGIEMSLDDLHHRISYAKDKGFRVLMYFADGVLSSKGLPDYTGKEGLVKKELWNGPDVLGGSYLRNIAIPQNYNFYKKYAKALFTEFATEVDGFVWDETFYIKSGHLGSEQYPGYLDRAQMRLIREVASILHSTAPNKAFFSSDNIGEETENAVIFGNNIPPYSIVADGCYQDSWNLPSYWSYGIFPNYRNVIWSCNWAAMENFKYTVFGVYAYNTPVVFTNGWENNKGFSEMTKEEHSNFISLFNYRKQFRTNLKGLESLPPYFEFAPEKQGEL